MDHPAQLRPDDQQPATSTRFDEQPEPSLDRNNATDEGALDTIPNHDNSLAIQKRLCWVCFGTEQDDEDPDVVWICPCQCKGSMKWVHEECVQRWVDEKQKRTNSMRVSCSQCKTQYILSFPPVNRFVRLIEQYDKLLYGSSPFVAVSVVLSSIYLCCGSYGFISIIQVMGYEEGRRLVDEADILLLIIGLPAIPIGLILAKLIKWEDFVLKVWRKSAFSLPRPLSYIIDKPPAKPRANCDQLLLDPGFNEPLGCTRMICGALLLPTVSALVGKIFFSNIGGSQWRRSLVGGLAFILIKGALKIYLRKSQYIRYSQRSIKNYVPSAKTALRTSASDTEFDGADDSHATTATSHETLPPASDEDLLDGDTDDEAGPPSTSHPDLDCLLSEPGSFGFGRFGGDITNFLEELQAINLKGDHL